MRYFYTWRRLFFPAPQGCNPSVSVLMCHCLRRRSAFKPLHQHLRRRSYLVEPQRGPVIVLTFDMECWIHIAVPFLAIKSLLSVVQLVYEVKGFINLKFQAELAVHILPFIITVTLLQQHVWNLSQVEDCLKFWCETRKWLFNQTLVVIAHMSSIGRS